MAKILTLNQARRAALRGQTSIAISALQTIAAAKNTAASSSLAELLAFSGRWEEVIPHAGKLIESPSAVYAGNVFNDMISLLGRAGHETGQWQQIRELVKSAWDTIDHTEEREHQRHRYFNLSCGSVCVP